MFKKLTIALALSSTIFSYTNMAFANNNVDASNISVTIAKAENINKKNISIKDAQTESIDRSVQILNGRLYFQNKENFMVFYNFMKEKDDDEIADILNKKLYSKGFFSLSPIVNEKTEASQFDRHFSKVQEQPQNKSSGAGVTENDFLNYFDDLEDIFGENIFGSLLNQDAEIRIADTIYQYTDHGLLMVNYKEYQKLNSLRESKPNIHSLGDINNVMNKKQYEIAQYMENEKGGYKNITSGVIHYMGSLRSRPNIGSLRSGPTIDNICPHQTDSNRPCFVQGHHTPPSNTINETYAEIAQISTTLEACSGNEPWLPNLFGTVKVCIDNYANKQRVKTKYWDVDFGLGFSIGVKVKHQKRGWTGFWRKQKTDKVALGINSLSWEFEIPNSVPPPSYNLARIYTDGLAWETILDNSQENMYPLGSVAVPNLPFNIDLDAIVEFSTSLPINGGFTSEYQVRKKFYDLLFGKVKNFLNTERNKDLKKLGLVVRTQTHIYVQYYDFTNYCSNCAKQRRVFDWGIATPSISYTFGEGSLNIGGGFPQAFTFDFNQARTTGANVFGMAKRDGIWHGSRMIFEE